MPGSQLRIVGSTHPFNRAIKDVTALAKTGHRNLSSHHARLIRNSNVAMPPALPQQPHRMNFALAANGGVATASSSYDIAPWIYTPAGTNNGVRTGSPAVSGEAWNGATNTFPQWVQIDFSGSKAIDEIDFFTVQDNWQNPAEPTETMTFSLYGVTGFDVQYWNGSSWVTVPDGSVSGNNNVWRRVTFSSITTTRIRVLMNASPDGYSRLTELEA